MKKRIWSILLVLCMALTLLPFGALAAEEQPAADEPVVFISGTCGKDATFEMTSDGVMTVTGTGKVQARKITYRNPDESLTTPTKKIVLSEGITEIGSRAFSELDFLSEIVLPNSLKRIGEHAFTACTRLTDVTWGTGIETIGAYAFESCGFTELVVPETVKSIGEAAFFDCIHLQSAVIYGEMSHLAFGGCDALETAAVMNATKLPDEAFRLCPKLKNVYLSDTITKLGGNSFEDCKSLTELRIPAKVTALAGGMFRGCSALEYLIMPAVSMIYDECFRDCPKLQEIYYAGTEAQLSAMQYYEDGNEQLSKVQVYLIPAMPDAIYGFFDMPAETNWAYDGVAFCLDSGFMNGMGDGYFQPNGVTTRAQLVTILWRMCDEPKAAKTLPFTDCKTHWAKDAIAWASENGIVNGVGKGLFDPDGAVTREQLVTIFYRFCKEYLELDVSGTQSLKKYPDAAKVSSWAKDAMQWGTAVKLISGVGTKNGDELQPQGTATRAQIARVIMNFCVNVAPMDENPANP